MVTRSDAIAAAIGRRCYHGRRAKAKAWRRYMRALRAETMASIERTPVFQAMIKIVANVREMFAKLGKALADGLASGILVLPTVQP